MTRLPQADLLAGLEAIVGAEHVSTTIPDLIAYSGDCWPKVNIWRMGGEVERHPPDCVVWPADEAEISAVTRFCTEHLIPMVPYGGGSGVVGGTVPVRGGVVVDVKRLVAVHEIDSSSQTITAQGGINGQHLEDRLEEAGYTLGHFPSSIMCSTLGGWLAARSAGQLSSKYGKIEDMVVSLRVVLPDGTVMDTSERNAGDPDWTQLIVGSEGTLGFITEATLRVHPQPERRALRGFKFHHLHDAMRGMRLVMQAGLKPMVLRLYDPFDTLMALGKEEEAPEDSATSRLLDSLKDWSRRTMPARKVAHPPTAPAGRRMARHAGRRVVATALSVPGLLNRLTHAVPSACLLIIGFEGPEASVERQAWRGRQILVEAGGTDAGSGPGDRWLERRYAVSFKASKLYQAGAFVDTMEVATTWDRLETLYEAVQRAVAPHAMIMAHFSHAYREGCSIYFTFAAYRRQPERAEALYDRLWAAALDAAHRTGATASHHHGVGMSKMHAMGEEHGEMLRVWRALKDAVDPLGIMNPGKLYPDRAGAP